MENCHFCGHHFREDSLQHFELDGKTIKVCGLCENRIDGIYCFECNNGNTIKLVTSSFNVRLLCKCTGKYKDDDKSTIENLFSNFGI